MSGYDKVIELIECGERNQLLPELVHAFGTFACGTEDIEEAVNQALDYFAITPEDVGQ